MDYFKEYTVSNHDKKPDFTFREVRLQFIFLL